MKVDLDNLTHMVTPERKYQIVLAEYDPMEFAEGWSEFTSMLITKEELEQIDAILGKAVEREHQEQLSKRAKAREQSQ